MTEKKLGLPFSGIKVLDFSHLLPGELCGTMLADLGCDVLRIEPLEAPLGQKIPPVVKGESLFFWSRHSNQRRIALNLKASGAREIVSRLFGEADVLIENFRPGVMDRLGMGFKDAKAINEKLIYCSISGYGQATSWSSRPGHDLNFIAESGILAQNSYPNERPVPPSVLISDYSSALYAALGVAAALFNRERNQQTDRVDVSMLESALSTMGMLATIQSFDPKLKNFRYPSDAPNYSVYECADGRYLAVASIEQPFWKTFCERAELPEFINLSHIESRKEIHASVSARIKEKTLNEWSEIFEGSNCCVSPVKEVHEALEIGCLKERRALATTNHSELGELLQVPTPLFQHQQESVRTAHTDRVSETGNVLKELGYTDEEMEKFRNEGAILSS